MQLGLPSRDYFLQLESDEALSAYHNYMTSVAVIMGAHNHTTARREMRDVLEFEMQMANVSAMVFDSG